MSLPPTSHARCNSTPAPPEWKPGKPSFYRRPLPEICTAFSSQQGRQYFREALSQGNMECYFPLAEQFSTQSEPAYCGLTTLSVVLNALSLDPNRLWKGAWRWYSEELLDCCKPLKEIMEDGIELREFCCLAMCNGANTKTFLVSHHDHTLERFRDQIKKSCRDDSASEYMVVNYDRGTLNQTGTGHFSPIGGYHEESDQVLILDVARFKYPPYWVSVELLYKSLFVPDTASGKMRGWVLVSRPKMPRCALLCSLNYTHETSPMTIGETEALFAKLPQHVCAEPPARDIDSMISRVMSLLPEDTPDSETGNCSSLSDEHQQLVEGMIASLAKSEICQAVHKHLPSSYKHREAQLAPFLTLLLMAMPHTIVDELSDELHNAWCADIDRVKKDCPLLVSELSTIEYQIANTSICGCAEEKGGNCCLKKGGDNSGDHKPSDTCSKKKSGGSGCHSENGTCSNKEGGCGAK